MPSRPRFRRHASGPTRTFAWPGLMLAVVVLLAGPIRAAEVPAYFAAALARFTADAPHGWAYTLAVTRGGESSIESFDPSRPAGRQWMLQKRNGKPPTPDETDRYLRYRETNNASAAARTTFERGDLDFASAQIVHEDGARAVIRCLFRRDAAEPMLAHLELFLVVVKNPAAVEKSTLRLTSPYSPVIGMKMNELEVGMTFSPPTEDHPGLPLAAASRFRGHILWFWSVEEDSQVAYSDFHRAASAAEPASSK
jgi:hypothetical protein